MLSEFCGEVERILCCRNILVTEDEQEIPLKHTNKFWSSFRNDEMFHHLDYKDNQEGKLVNLSSLPTEIIIKIISSLDDIQDIRNCMLLSKNIRDSIFKTSKIMRKVLVSLNSSEASEFLNFRGNSIRCLKIQSHNEDNLKLIFRKVPNLEELTFKNNQFTDKFTRQSSIIQQELDKYNKIVEGLDDKLPSDLRNLKVLEIRLANFEMFTKSTKNITKLEKFTIYLTELRDDELLLKFLNQQSILKELIVINISQFHIIDFPCLNFCVEVKFRLKILKLIRIKFDNYLARFLESQLESLKELELTEVGNHETLEAMFMKSRKLKKLSLGAVACSMIFANDFPDLRMQSLETYEDRNSKGVELDKIYERFPNLLNLKCLQLMPINGIFDKIVSLELFVLDCQKLKDLQLKSLSILTIIKVSRFSDATIWEKFTKNIKNIEILTIKHVEDLHNIPQILKHLKNFQRLQTFKLKQASYYDDYEITIDTKLKTVKTLRSSVEKNQEILKVLHENFDDFEFFEFKSFVGKIKKFDIVMQLDKH
ncbi:unnamed protein product [Chironomus riparius]|uniref:F-box domain-containing protein n=1 Tax=Chironomus riparius TaxID=315576 RepID=A0A9N9WY43_9DIPT|nr:unnamed protein product [Chironomus riparius]